MKTNENNPDFGKDFFAKRSQNKKIVDNVFAMGVRVEKAKKLYGDSVINGTIGSLLDEQENILIFDAIKSTYYALSTKEHFSYADTFSGTNDYKEAVKNWIFLPKHLEALKEFHIEVTASPGASGAVSSAIHNFLDPGEKLLISHISYPIYDFSIKEYGALTVEYSLFTQDLNFNFDDLEKKAWEILKTQDKLVLLLNDPCQNPTGYSLSRSEWATLCELLNKIAQVKKVVFLLDIAYIDFDPRGKNLTRNFLFEIAKLHKNVFTILMFSCSKSFSCYGLRSGAQIAITQSKDVIDAYKNIQYCSCLGIWATTSRVAMTLFATILSNPNYLQALEIEQEKSRDILCDRADIFIEEADLVGLKHYPYGGGFFITLIEPNTPEKIDKFISLCADNHIFLIPLKNGIRIAISSIPIRKIPGLATKLKKILTTLHLL
ncbi:MAG: aminotransferase class I/II-fold pyridoxal phosphate-dependent enzyme [Fusobacteria bacterium]|nr:aminotransferase class I/II-fold pyridoxal phosphate-dependent enzyme [Fusobacteriota bacterium]